MWMVYAIGSSFFAGITAILAKCGIKKTDSDVAITDILNARGLDSNAVNKKIKLVVQEAADEARSVQSTGYNIYERDLSNSMYDVKNVTNFIQGPSGELYIIYAYGNVAFTSEMDIIEI